MMPLPLGDDDIANNNNSKTMYVWMIISRIKIYLEDCVIIHEEANFSSLRATAIRT